MHADELALLNAIISAPDEDPPRLVYEEDCLRCEDWDRLLARFGSRLVNYRH
jgi:hypothetical protein